MLRHEVITHGILKDTPSEPGQVRRQKDLSKEDDDPCNTKKLAAVMAISTVS